MKTQKPRRARLTMSQTRLAGYRAYGTRPGVNASTTIPCWGNRTLRSTQPPPTASLYASQKQIDANRRYARPISRLLTPAFWLRPSGSCLLSPDSCPASVTRTALEALSDPSCTRGVLYIDTLYIVTE